MGGDSKPVNSSNPCHICGKTDWCNIVTFDDGTYLSYCKRVSGTPKSLTVAGGETYICKFVTKGGFTAWEPKIQYDRNREKWLRENGYKKNGNNDQSYDFGEVSTNCINWNDIPLEGAAECNDPKRLNEVYKAFLSLLILEDKHKERLLLEWSGELFNEIVDNYIIKSVPPEDRIRFSSKERLKNLSRKKIMEKLIEMVGEPLGVPGFYQRKDGVWTFYYLCGIAYPVYDSDGNIIRLRIGTDYSVVEGNFGGMDGEFVYGLIGEDAGWFFRSKRLREAILVWKYGAENNKISLNKKGYPEGKVKGKYKSFTSFREKRFTTKDGVNKRVNTFTNGSQATLYCSLYRKPSDDYTVVYVTEGEKKAMVGNLLLNVPVIAVPGVNSLSPMFENELGKENSMIDELIKRGTKAFVIVYDADKNVNEAVLNSEAKLVDAFKERGIKVAIGEWNANWGKGLDDILLTGVRPDVRFVI